MQFYLKADDLTEKNVFSINAAFSFDDGQECMFHEELFDD